MKLIFHTMRPANLHSPDLLFFMLMLEVYSSMSLPAKSKEKMSRQCGTLHRGNTGRGGGLCKANLRDIAGYITQVSMPIRCMIDEWESKVVSEHLASRRSGGRINHYWLIRNTMGLLMEDMTTKWNGARDMA